MLFPVPQPCCLLQVHQVEARSHIAAENAKQSVLHRRLVQVVQQNANRRGIGTNPPQLLWLGWDTAQRPAAVKTLTERSYAPFSL